jgi:signal transduction histidine kinase
MRTVEHVVAQAQAEAPTEPDTRCTEILSRLHRGARPGRRPFWLSDSCCSGDISSHFRGASGAEDVGRRDNRATRTQADDVAGPATAELVAERARCIVDAAVQAERRRIARELQRAVGATLLALRYGIRRLAAAPGLDHDIRSRMVDIEAQAVEAGAALRRCLRLSSAPPASLSLPVAVRTLCDAFQRRTAIATRLTTLTYLPPMTAWRVAALADAVRESLLNVEKHARARSVVATIFARTDRVAITISDDGVGLPARATLEHGLGIAAVGEGLARVGGALTIAPNEDGGVTVHAWVPT